MAIKKPRCYNCVNAGYQFKIDRLTHLHCSNPREYSKEKGVSPWETLRVFNETCPDHDYKKDN